MYDVVIIGAGVCGCAIARELSRYQLNICVVDKATDVGEGTSKANSAVIHAGFDARPGSLKAQLNVRGNQMMDKIADTLDFPFRRNGTMVLCTDATRYSDLEKLLDQGRQNGVEHLAILMGKEVLRREPYLTGSVYAALWAQDGGIVCPFLMTIAYAENAAANGVEFRLGTEVKAIRKVRQGSSSEVGYEMETDKGMLCSRCVVNAAGVYADVFHNMVSEKKIHITPRRGVYYLMDQSVGDYVSHTIFQLPGKMGKGVLVTPTVHGNLLIGPTAHDIEDRDGTCTTAEELQELVKKAGGILRDIPMRQVITSFAGLRAHEDGGEFIIGEAEDAKGFIDVAGIESPGLSSAPAIGEYVRDLVAALLMPREKTDFVEERRGIPDFSELSVEEKKNLIAENPAYGNMICRCEMVTEGEILDAIHRSPGATTLDGVKRRTRAGMGRCQQGFCSTRVMEILSRELGIPLTEVKKNGDHSQLVMEKEKTQEKGDATTGGTCHDAA